MLPNIDLVQSNGTRWRLLEKTDLVSKHIREHGFLGLNELMICLLLIGKQQAPVVLDVGANLVGFTVPVVQKLQETRGKVICFEPQRVVLQQLCANVFINRLDNVAAFNYALGNEDKIIKIPELDLSYSHNIGAFSVNDEIRRKMIIDAGETGLNIETGSVVPVQQRKLDSLELEDNIRFIKVDSEGYELEFFKGAEARELAPETIRFDIKELKKWGYEFSNLGAEVLAQHPSHPAKVDVISNGNSFNVSLRR